MRSVWAVVCLLVLETALGNAQGPAGAASTTGRTALTIYNQDFAVIRTPVPRVSAHSDSVNDST